MTYFLCVASHRPYAHVLLNIFAVSPVRCRYVQDPGVLYRTANIALGVRSQGATLALVGSSPLYVPFGPIGPLHSHDIELLYLRWSSR